MEETDSTNSAAGPEAYKSSLKLDDKDLFGGKALLKKYQRWLRVEIVGICILMAIVWGLLSLPIVFYYIPVPVDNGEQSENITQAIFQNVSVSPLECRENFFREEVFNTCVPICSSWRQDPPAVSITTDVVVFLSYFTGFVVAAVIIVISIFRYKAMLSFPNSLVVCMTIVYIVQNIFYIVTYIDRSGLYCASKNLFTTFSIITPYCVIAGMAQVYSTLSVALWWFMLVAALFWKIWFPFNAKIHEVKLHVKYIHIGCVIIGVMIPFIPIIALMSGFAESLKSDNPLNRTFISGGLGFVGVRFPPISCNGYDKVIIFYATILPTNIILTSGITLTILIFWLVHKQHGLFKAKQFKNPYKIGVAERKLLIVFCYYIVSTVIALTAFADFARKSDIFAAELDNYFICELGGHDPTNPCDRARFEGILSATLIVFAYAVHGLLPTVNLIFVISFKDLKSKCSMKNILSKSSEDEKNAPV